jgi:Delta14-sterol reductase
VLRAGECIADEDRPGVTVISLALPIVTYSLLFLCNGESGCPAPSLLSPSTLTLEKLQKDVNWQGLPSVFNVEALLATFGWYGLSLVLYAILPAQEVDGTLLSNGVKLKYRLNSMTDTLCFTS